MGQFYLDVYPKNEYKVWFAGLPYNMQPKVLKSLTQWAKEQNADIVYNLAMFNMTHGKYADGTDYYGGTVQYVHAGGKDLGYGGALERLTLPNGDTCNGYKTAIVNGVIKSGLSKVGRTSRNCNGFLKNGDYFHLQTSADVTEYECAVYMKDKASLMLMQDGGGSTGKVVNGKLVFSPQGSRNVATVVCIKKLAASTPPKTEPNIPSNSQPNPTQTKETKSSMETNLPLNGDITVTARYGDVNTKLWKNGHKGIDFVGSDNVYATCDGVVTVVAFDANGWGQYISIKPNDNPNRRHLFCHLAKGSQRVKVGDRVSRKTIIGIMGATGNVTGKHLHYEIRDNNVPINPAEYLGIPNERGTYNWRDYILDKIAPKPKFSISIDGMPKEEADALKKEMEAKGYKCNIKQV